MASPELLARLERARSLGFLGPGPVEEHIAHSAAFLEALEPVLGTVVDLGSGGGVPGLVVAEARPDLHLVLVDAMVRRTAVLTEAVAALGLESEVVTARAEVFARGPRRASLEAVLARSFGPPAATAECSAPLLRPGGVLLVSEPPHDVDRWPADGLAQLGMVLGPRVRADGATVQVLVQASTCPERFPRRDGIPAKRPLFGR